jgi:hypothetical protein
MEEGQVLFMFSYGDGVASNARSALCRTPHKCHRFEPHPSMALSRSVLRGGYRELLETLKPQEDKRKDKVDQCAAIPPERHEYKHETRPEQKADSPADPPREEQASQADFQDDDKPNEELSVGENIGGPPLPVNREPGVCCEITVDFGDGEQHDRICYGAHEKDDGEDGSEDAIGFTHSSCLS